MEQATSQYKLQDRAHGLAKQVDQLQLLIQHQGSTITNLKQESLDKSRRILELEQFVQTKAQVTTQTDSVFTPKLHLSSIVSNTRNNYGGEKISPRDRNQISQGSIDVARIAEKKLILLQDEKSYWRRHYEEADSQARKLKRLLEAERLLRSNDCQDKYLAKHLSDQGVNVESGVYIKTLLEENYQLKEKLSKVGIKAKVGNSANARDAEKSTKNDEENVNKENIENCQFYQNAQTSDNQGYQTSAVSRNKPQPPTKPNQPGSPKKRVLSTQQQRATRPLYRGAPKPPTRSQSNSATKSGKQEQETTKSGNPESTESGKSADNCSASTSCPASNLPADNTNVSDAVMSQVAQLKEELERKAQELSCCCCHDIAKRRNNSCSDDVCSKRPTNSKFGRSNSAKSSSVIDKSKETCAATQNVCFRCRKITCRNESGVRFDESIDPTTIHLCQHIRCLQRQVCHLQHGLTNQNTELSSLKEARADLAQVRCQLQRANTDISNLRCTNSELCKTRQLCMQENEILKRKLETLLSGVSQDAKVKKLIEDIEIQRDRYKNHVESLLKDINSDRKTSEECLEEENACKPTDQQKSSLKQGTSQNRRVNFTGVDLLHPDPEESELEESSSDVKEEIIRLQNELHSSRMEVHRLRRELMDTLTKKPGDIIYSDSPSKPSISCPPPSDNDPGYPTYPPSSTPQGETADTCHFESADRRELEVERNRLTAEREILELQRKQLQAERDQITKEKSIHEKSVMLARSKSTPSLPHRKSVDENENDYVENSCRTEMEQLKKKIYFLEKQLENTENALRTNQNLVAENSSRNYEQSSQMLQLKQALNQANRTGDELRSKLEKNDDLLRRITDEKNQLLKEVNAQHDKSAALNIQLAECKERISQLKQEIQKLEQRSSEENKTSAETDRRLAERVDELQELERRREEWRNAEQQSVKNNSELGLLREEHSRVLDQLKEQTIRNEELENNLNGVNIQLQKFIDKVSSLEVLLEEKENARRVLMVQYEQISRDLHQVETINRNLEMQAENMSLEVKSRDADLEAVRTKSEQTQQYIESMIRHNEHLKTQIISLNAKVEMLGADLQENRIARDSVLDDLNGVNSLAVKLNTDKVELLHKIGEQNSVVEKLNLELSNLKQDLLQALSSIDDEKHRSKTLERLVTESTEVRETVIKELRRDEFSEDKEGPTSQKSQEKSA